MGGGSGTGPILLSQATFLLAHIANSGPVPLSASSRFPLPIYCFTLWRAPELFVIQSLLRHFSLAISALHKSSPFFPSNELISNIYIKITA